MPAYPKLLPALCLNLLLVLLLTLCVPVAIAHEGHDHDTSAQPAAAVSLPYFEASGTGVELLGRLHHDSLELWLDDWDSNAPLSGFQMEIATGDWSVIASETAPGQYLADAGPLTAPGRHPLMLFVQGNGIDELLIATLETPQEENQQNVRPQDIQPGLSMLSIQSGELLPQAAILLLVFLCGAGLSALLLRRRPAAQAATTQLDNPASPGNPDSPARSLQTPLQARLRAQLQTGLLAGLLAGLFSGGLLSAPPAHAHPGHDHDDEPVVSTDRPARLPDGGLHLPKTSQHLLEVRTQTLQPAPLSPAIELNGRTVVNPDASALVQAPREGRLLAVADRLPLPGQWVRKGQPLIRLLPLAPAIEHGEKATLLAGIDGDLEAARQQLQRLQQMHENISRKELEDAEVLVRSLQRQQQMMRAGLYQEEALDAPRNGLISLASVRNGQVVAAGDTLFEIIDPQRLWVEALLYAPGPLPAIKRAEIRLPNGKVLKAALVAHEQHLQRQAQRLYLEIELELELEPNPNQQPPPPPLAIGQPVSVVLTLQGEAPGLAIPRSAAVRDEQGQWRLWLKSSAERFVPRAVSLMPLDGARLAVLEGVQAGERVVVQGASLLEQIR